MDSSRLQSREFIEHLPDVVFAIERDGTLSFVNESAGQLFGMDSSQLANTYFVDLFEPDSGNALWSQIETCLQDSVCVEGMHAVTRDGRDVEVTLVLVAGDPAQSPAAHGVLKDVTRRLSQELQLTRAIDTDHLTQLANRRHFDVQLDRAIDRTERTGMSAAILWLNLDFFSGINDTLGSHAGDDALVLVAQALQSQMGREGDSVSRVGGDEFAVLLSPADADRATAVADRLLEAVADVTLGSKMTAELSASIGIAIFPEPGVDAEEVLSCAHMAMRSAKDGGRGRWVVCEQEWGERLHDRQSWAERITRAFEDGRIVPYAQPLLDLRTNTISKYELLVRMFAEDGTAVSPDRFLAAAERVGLSGEIDRVMLDAAGELLGAFGDRNLMVNVNLSPRRFLSPDSLDQVRDAVLRSGACPGCLGIEILESTVISDLVAAQARISEIKAMGCRVALDDFGSGFSSFFHLRHLPFDELKIDGSYVQHLATNPADQHFVKAIAELAKGLGMQTVAEFVADARSAELLRGAGVDYAQGYFVAKPAPAWEIVGATLGTSMG